EGWRCDLRDGFADFRRRRQRGRDSTEISVGDRRYHSRLGRFGRAHGALRLGFEDAYLEFAGGQKGSGHGPAEATHLWPRKRMGTVDIERWREGGVRFDARDGSKAVLQGSRDRAGKGTFDGRSQLRLAGLQSGWHRHHLHRETESFLVAVLSHLHPDLRWSSAEDLG